ncbi:hypothetical protein K523DRAFT_258323 [Schizophyllum commune Tattone D]|nr:hypothetical protein K523DRAFT_258323 [Schizophyllum commune Tattone D]
MLRRTVAATQPAPPKGRRAPSSRSTPTPKYLEHCYKWLSCNLHNPYPSRTERENLASSTGVSLKDVTDWFVAVRQRIGWSHLRATRFERSQLLIVDAASRFWPERDTARPLDPDVELRFAEIEANVKSLYANVLQPSTTLVQLLQDEKRSTSAKEQSRRSASESNISKKRRSEDADLDADRPAKRRSVSDRPTPTKASSGRAARARSSTPTTSGRKAAAPSAAPPITLTITPARSQLPPPKFGEPSLQSTTSTPSLKRCRSVDDASPDAKRRRVLPEWRDPRSPQARIYRSLRASKSSDGPRSAPSGRTISSQSHQNRGGRSHDGRRTVSAPVAPHIALDASIDGLAWPSVLSLPAHTTVHSEVTLPLPCNDNLDLWNLPPSSLDAGIPILASNDISHNLLPFDEASDPFADVPSTFDPIATSPTSSASSPPGSAPITPPKLTPQLTGDSTVDVGTDPWGGLFGQSDFPYDSCADPLASSSSDIDFLTMLANDRPLCGDNYNLDDFCNPCSWWDSPVDALPGNDAAPVATPAVAERPGKRALPTEDEYLNFTPPKRRRLAPAAT